MIPALPTFPIPVPEGVPSWLLAVVVIGVGAAVLVVLVLQAVRYFRADRDDDSGDSGS